MRALLLRCGVLAGLLCALMGGSPAHAEEVQPAQVQPAQVEAAQVEAAQVEAAEVQAEDADGVAVGIGEPPAGPPLTDEATIDTLTTETSSGLRCPVCQGLSVNDSPADGARAMKARIRELVEMGYSRAQIEDYFVDRYGVWVLLAPPDQGRHLAVWLGPVVFLLVGVGAIGLLLRTRAQVEPDAEAPTSVAADAAPVAEAAGQPAVGATPDDAAPAIPPSAAPPSAAPPPSAGPDALEPYRRRILAELGLAPGEQP